MGSRAHLVRSFEKGAALVGIFDYPRIHVFGTQLVNAGTANNDSIGPGTEITVTSDSQRVQPVLGDMTPEQFRNWVIGLDESDPPLLRCQWNYYGDMSLRFLDVVVVSVQHEPGRIETDPDADPLIGAHVHLDDAVVCDNNPEGFNTTQIFADSLTIRSAPARPAFGGTGIFVSRRPTRAVTRFLNWSRNVSFHGVLGRNTSGGAAGASAGFQSSFEILPEDLVDRPDPAVEEFEHHFIAADASPTVERLVELLRRRDGRRPMRGLTFRYNLHLAYPSHSDSELAERFAAGERTENPAVGVVAGTIAPWYVGEPESATAGRVMNPTKPYPNPYTTSRPYYLAPAVARVDPERKILSIDLSSTLPADGKDGYPFDLGTITVGARKPTVPTADPNQNDHEIRVIGTIDPDRDVARSCGFLYDLDYSHLSEKQQRKLEGDRRELVLDTDLAGVLLFEPEHQVLLDSECNYLEDLAPGETWRSAIPPLRSPRTPTPMQARSPIVIHRRGHAVTGPVRFTVEQWRMTPSGDPANFGFYQYPIKIHEAPRIVTVNDGWGTVDLIPETEGPGLRLFRFVPSSFWPQDRSPDAFSWLICAEFYATTRILPYDDYAAILERGPTFGDVYEHVFMYYDLLLPAMNVRLPMDDPSIWESPTAARYLKRVIDPALWASTHYMPRTRDLSAPRRELLNAFCDSVIARHERPGREGDS